MVRQFCDWLQDESTATDWSECTKMYEYNWINLDLVEAQQKGEQWKNVGLGNKHI